MRSKVYWRFCTSAAGVLMRHNRPCNRCSSIVGTAAIGCLLLALLAPPEVQGQSLEECGVDLRVGAAVPVGELRDEIGPGWTLGAALDCHARWPWTLRGGVELAVLSDARPLDLGQASALAGGEFSVPVERWPMLVRARLEGGWTLIGRQGFSDSRPRRLMLVESGPVLAPGVGVTLGSGNGRRARVDAGVRILFQNPDPEDPALEWSAEPAFDRVGWFVLMVGVRL